MEGSSPKIGARDAGLKAALEDRTYAPIFEILDLQQLWARLGSLNPYSNYQVARIYVLEALLNIESCLGSL